jgi:hypothetical protein
MGHAGRRGFRAAAIFARLIGATARPMESRMEDTSSLLLFTYSQTVCLLKSVTDA